ncbi:hypothetical protein K8640_15735 [Myxococcus sp. XM-1-1-1]|jgi:hypothetical protein|nr:hypothetical protein [Myxococcus sp. XM-1-1-1]
MQAFSLKAPHAMGDCVMSIDKPSKSAARMGPRPATSKPTPPAPRPASPKTGAPSTPRRDRFDGHRLEGAGLPIRLSGQPPRPFLRLPLRPWTPHSKLEPWSGVPQKPWLRYPDLFGTGATARPASPCGCGLPIRLS